MLVAPDRSRLIKIVIDCYSVSVQLLLSGQTILVVLKHNIISERIAFCDMGNVYGRMSFTGSRPVSSNHTSCSPSKAKPSLDAKAGRSNSAVTAEDDNGVPTVRVTRQMSRNLTRRVREDRALRRSARFRHSSGPATGLVESRLRRAAASRAQSLPSGSALRVTAARPGRAPQSRLRATTGTVRRSARLARRRSS